MSSNIKYKFRYNHEFGTKVNTWLPIDGNKEKFKNLWFTGHRWMEADELGAFNKYSLIYVFVIGCRFWKII